MTVRIQTEHPTLEYLAGLANAFPAIAAHILDREEKLRIAVEAMGNARDHTPDDSDAARIIDTALSLLLPS